MKIYEIITESPVVDYGTINTHNPYKKHNAFKNPKDIQLLRNQNYEANIKRFFEKTPFNFRLFFVNIPNVGDYAIIDHDNPRELSVNDLRELLDPEHEGINQHLLKHFTNNMNSTITILYAGNAETIDGKIADNVMPITPWIAAHRIGHALDDFDAPINMHNFSTGLFEEIHELIQTVYSLEYDIDEFEFGEDRIKDPLVQVAHTIGTQRSSRNKLLTDNVYEFTNELLAQYLNTGTVTLNPFPKYIIYDGLQYHGNGQEQSASQSLITFIEYYFEKILNAAVGKIFII